MLDFAAIDFETANEQPSSVCSVGVVVVRDGEIVDTFYSLIHPEPEYYQWFCRRVHGLGPEDTEDAPVFPYVWERIEPLIEGLPTRSRPRDAISAASFRTIGSKPSPPPAASTSSTTTTPSPTRRPAPQSRGRFFSRV